MEGSRYQILIWKKLHDRKLTLWRLLGRIQTPAHFNQLPSEGRERDGMNGNDHGPFKTFLPFPCAVLSFLSLSPAAIAIQLWDGNTSEWTLKWPVQKDKRKEAEDKRPVGPPWAHILARVESMLRPLAIKSLYIQGEQWEEHSDTRCKSILSLQI